MLSGVPRATCLDLINKGKQKALQTGNPDLCAEENIVPDPNSLKGSNKALSAKQQRTLIELALSDATHYCMLLGELGAAAGLNVGINTISKTLKADGIYRHASTKTPLMNDNHKAAHLAFCLQHRQQNWQDIIFTDESYFETCNLLERRARGVIRCTREAFTPCNMNRKFQGGATVMFWGAILYRYPGSQLPYYVYKTPYETTIE
ncbi:uncharacterized protein H6S33_002867 [Morchella sextelata]|uniref:uncharacterized protein n=1 Tax=Morchella sextelata TaxID=1174677 RepID=UPI001D0562A6|nr:uncharacterized protein H6S33_002867 [Morchella sextelata]KAH0607833.1 hypothetical protein H6S33_002867 [Morchella sextelata]